MEPSSLQSDSNGLFDDFFTVTEESSDTITDDDLSMAITSAFNQRIEALFESLNQLSTTSESIELSNSATVSANSPIPETGEYSEKETVFKVKLLSLLRDSDCDSDMESDYERYILKMLRFNSSTTREWVNSIFIANWCDEHIVSVLLTAVSHLPRFLVYPNAETMAIAALSHPSPLVREAGIRAFEYWEDPDNLYLLKNLKIDEPWLDKYRNQVIIDIETL